MISFFFNSNKTVCADKTFFSDYFYSALDVLIFYCGLIRWKNNKSVNHEFCMSKWNVDGYSIGKPELASIESFFFAVINAW